MSYLIVNTTDFSGNFAPSQIIPGVEYVKSSERSLNGNLHVDIAAVKQRLQVIFGILNQPTYDEVMRRFEVTADISKINPEGIDVTYFDVNNSEKRCGKFAVENVTFNPLVTEDGVLWRDVMIDLVEL